MSRGSSRRLIPEPNSVAMVRLLTPRARGGLDRGDDVLIAGAAAKIALDRVPDLPLARAGVLRQQVDRGQDDARGAEAALQSVLLPKRLLQRVQRAISREPLDRRDLAAFRLDCEHRAALHRPAVEQHRAGAALTRVATDM